MTDNLLKLKLADKRWQRVMQHPVRAFIIAILRRLHTSKEVVVGLPFGLKFVGILPEAVTALVWRFGVYEWSTTVLFARLLRDGDHVIDIGSHFGYFTILSAKLVGDTGRVIAIEAMPETYERLERNVSINQLKNVQAVNAAAHSGTGFLKFRDFDAARGGFRVVRAAARANRFRKSIPPRRRGRGDLRRPAQAAARIARRRSTLN